MPTWLFCPSHQAQCLLHVRKDTNTREEERSSRIFLSTPAGVTRGLSGKNPPVSASVFHTAELDTFQPSYDLVAQTYLVPSFS